MLRVASPAAIASPGCAPGSGTGCGTSARSAIWPRRSRAAMPNLAANPQLVIYAIAGLAAVFILLIGFGIYAVATAPQARLKRRISAVVGDPLPVIAIPGTGRRDVQGAAKRKKQIQ